MTCLMIALMLSVCFILFALQAEASFNEVKAYIRYTQLKIVLIL